MTRLTKLTRVLLCSAVLIGGADIIGSTNSFNFVSQAEARQKTLFEVLFPRAAARKRAKELALKKANQPEIKKISAPRYYKYKPEALKLISFAALSEKLAPATPMVEEMHTGAIAPASPDVTQTGVEGETAPQVETTTSDTQTLDTQIVENNVSEEVSDFLENTALSRSETIVSSSEPLPAPTMEQTEQNNFEPETVATKTSFVDHLEALSKIKVKAGTGVRKALLQHYENSPEFLWLNADMSANENAESVLKVLRNAAQEGLDPLNYAVSIPDTTSGEEGIEQALAFEIALTARAMRYAADSDHGAVNPNKLSGYHDFPNNKPDFAKIVKALSASPSPSNHLATYQPRIVAYNQLKQELAELSGENDPGERIVIAAGTLLKPGNSSDQVPIVVAAIKKRGSRNLLTMHEATLAGFEGEIYTPELVDLVKAFQRENKLGADGIIGRATIAKLVGISSQGKINRVKYAMERLRWHPAEFGARHVFINQPSYRATYMVNGKPGLSMRAIVGKASNQTSFFHDTIESVVYNPYWGVPRSILVNEMLPKLRANPSYLDERGYEVTNGKGQQVASSSIDWTQVGSRPKYDVRQTPGPRNALGELKILFPNKHAIYMHDTPSRGLFKRDFRALSHGCVRLQNPRGMAAAVLGTSVSRVTSMLAKGHSKQRLSEQMPVYVAYFTAWPTQDGKIQYFRDIYKRDRALSKAIVATANSRQAEI